MFHLCWRALQNYVTKDMDTGRSEELGLLIQPFALLRPLPPLISPIVFPLDFIHIFAQTTLQFAMPFGIIKGAFLWKTFNLHLGCLNSVCLPHCHVHIFVLHSEMAKSSTRIILIHIKLFLN